MYPARAPHALAVSATTGGGCLAAYSDHGGAPVEEGEDPVDPDIAAPGGGRNAIDDDPACAGKPNPSSCSETAASPLSCVWQVTFNRYGDYNRFGIRGRTGTSMAAAHVSGAAALVIASLGGDPTPDEVADRLADTAVDLGVPGFDPLYGAGLLNADAATAP
jgi:subtilisin family serine protease